MIQPLTYYHFWYLVTASLPTICENVDQLRDRNAHLRDNFMLVCDSLGEQDIRNVSMGDTSDGFWSSLGKSLLSSKARADKLVLGAGN